MLNIELDLLMDLDLDLDQDLDLNLDLGADLELDNKASNVYIGVIELFIFCFLQVSFSSRTPPPFHYFIVVQNTDSSQIPSLL